MQTSEQSTPPPRPGEILVFIVRRDGLCAECRKELWHHSFIRLVNGQPLCLDCADLGHLEFLPRGDAAVTRRASKFSSLRAVVLEWSRSRKRYERQGILATTEAIQKAEEECLADVEARERRRERESARRASEDDAFRKSFARAICEQFPGCPSEEANTIARHACQKHSGRIGRTAAARELDPTAVQLAVIAHIRHAHTRYDELLMRTDDRATARHEIREDVERVLAKWQRGNAA